MAARIHDLLEIDAQRFLDAHPSLPLWVAETLQTVPFVVVRRGPSASHEIPVGVRGAERNQRWAGLCDRRWVRRVVTPARLRDTVLEGSHAKSRVDTIPAMRSLAHLVNRDGWKDLSCPWGPGGSVGFELATGHSTAKPTSDLDIVIYADRRLSVEEARRLHASTQGLPSAVDVRVETPICGFSLAEYVRVEVAPARAVAPATNVVEVSVPPAANAPAAAGVPPAASTPVTILLRLPSGVTLGPDPWNLGTTS
jgi:phosphoribosyl-dephospho-CoA transferase